MAAMANGDGGIIIFGVRDKPREIIGAKNDFDGADLSNLLKQYFDPFIQHTLVSTSVGKLQLHAILVQPSSQRPVICRKVVSGKKLKKSKMVDEVILEEAAIYKRYGAQTKKIDYSDLQTILKERQLSDVRSIMQNFEIMQKVGFQNVGIVDAQKSKLAGATSLYVSAETAKGLNFLHKGKLVEDGGAPAYSVIGEVELKTGIEVPIPDNDRLKPRAVLTKLQPLFKQTYPTRFASKKLTDKQVKALACHYKFRDKNSNSKCDGKNCFYDSLTKSLFYRNAFVTFIEKQLKTNKADVEKIIVTAGAKQKK